MIEDRVQSTAFDDSNLQSEVICEEVEIAKEGAFRDDIVALIVTESFRNHEREGEYVKKETNDTSRREVVRLKVMLEIDSYKLLVLSDDSDAVN